MAWPRRPVSFAPGESSFLDKGLDGSLRRNPSLDQGDIWRWRNKGTVMRWTLRAGGEQPNSQGFVVLLQMVGRHVMAVLRGRGQQGYTQRPEFISPFKLEPCCSPYKLLLSVRSVWSYPTHVLSGVCTSEDPSVGKSGCPTLSCPRVPSQWSDHLLYGFNHHTLQGQRRHVTTINQNSKGILRDALLPITSS